MLTQPTSSHAVIFLLLAHLVLSPLVFSRFSVEIFEFPKMLLLGAGVMLLVGLSLWRWMSRPLTGTWDHVAGTMISVGRDPIALGVVILLLSGCVSTVFSLSPWTSLRGDPKSFGGLGTLAAYCLLFFFTRAAVDSVASVHALLWAAILASVCAAGYAALQFAGLDPIPWARYSNYRGWLRVWSTMGHPNFLSALLAMTIPIAAAFTHRAWLAREVFASILLAGATVGSTIVAVATLSRAAWIAVACALVVLVVGWWSTGARSAARGLIIVCLAAVLLAAAGVAATGKGEWLAERVAERAHALRTPTDNPRFGIWEAALGMVAAEPVTGVGLDAFRVAFPRYQPAHYWHREWNTTPARAHNEALHIAATQGGLGLTGLVILCVGLVTGWRRALRGSQGVEPEVVVALGASMTAFVVQSLFSFTVVALGTFFVSCAAVLSRVAYGSITDRRGARPIPAHELAVALSLAGACAVGLFLANVLPDLTPDKVGSATLACTAFVLSTTAIAWAAWRTERLPAQVSGTSAGPKIEPSGASTSFGVVRRAAPALCLVILIGAALHYTVYRPFVADTFCKNALNLVGSKFYRDAIPYFDTALGMSPGREDCWNQKALAQQQIGVAEPEPEARRATLLEALRSNEHSIDLVPESWKYRADRARISYDLFRTPGSVVTREQVESAFEEAVVKTPRNVILLVDASIASLVLENPEQAETYARRALELYPRYGPARAQLGLVAKQRQQWERAAKELTRSMTEKWTGREKDLSYVWAELADVQLRQERGDEALFAAWRAVTGNPKSARAYLLLGRSFDLRGGQIGKRRRAEGEGGGVEELRIHRDRAVEAYRRALNLDPDNVDARQALRRHFARERGNE